MSTLKEIVIKAENEAEHIVFAEVYAPNIADSDNEFMDAKTIKKMAYQFMVDMNLKNIDVQHDNNLVAGASVVESFIARKDDPIFIEGAWVVGVYVPDPETWDKIQKREINGFSLEALVTRTSVDIEMDIPPIIVGKTDSVEDHTHEFYVSYDEEGNYKGGTTNIVNGHKHLIKSGTITGTEEGHHHRFAFVDTIKLTEII